MRRRDFISLAVAAMAGTMLPGGPWERRGGIWSRPVDPMDAIYIPDGWSENVEMVFGSDRTFRLQGGDGIKVGDRIRIEQRYGPHGQKGMQVVLTDVQVTGLIWDKGRVTVKGTSYDTDHPGSRRVFRPATIALANGATARVGPFEDRRILDLPFKGRMNWGTT